MTDAMCTACDSKKLKSDSTITPTLTQLANDLPLSYYNSYAKHRESLIAYITLLDCIVCAIIN